MEWNIQARSATCQGCGRGFKQQEPFHTLLFDERDAYQRLDVCVECWQGQYAQGANHRKGFVSHWHGLFSVPPPAPPEPIQRDTAETLLRRLVAQNDPTHAGACFILAVMLERKRLLKVKAQTQTGDHRVFVYEHPKSGDVFTIPDPALRLDQLETVQRDVAQLLERGLDSAGEAAPVAAVPPAPAAAEAALVGLGAPDPGAVTTPAAPPTAG